MGFTGLCKTLFCESEGMISVDTECERAVDTDSFLFVNLKEFDGAE